MMLVLRCVYHVFSAVLFRYHASPISHVFVSPLADMILCYFRYLFQYLRAIDYFAAALSHYLFSPDDDDDMKIIH